MKRFTPKNKLRFRLLTLFFCLAGTLSHAQISNVITGKVTGSQGEPVAYANIVFSSVPDSSLVGGTISGEDGSFSFVLPGTGTYQMAASFVGYHSFSRTIKTAGTQPVELGEIRLEQNKARLDEVVIRKNRTRQKQQVDKTTYYVNGTMRSASQNGTDILKMVPVIQVDLFNKISLEGSENVVVLVNGMERDASFLGQIDADKIDRVEIRTSGGLQYGADVAGVINVILKAEKPGISGHIYANVPTKATEIFSFPSASLHYSTAKHSVYTSYTGGFSYFNIEGHRKVRSGDPLHPFVLTMKDQRKQENWSHKVHLGADLLNSDKNQLSLYGFLSSFSNEQDGVSMISLNASQPENETFHIERDDSDCNRSAYGSMYFRRQMNASSQLIAEASYYMLNSLNTTRLSDPASGISQVAGSAPGKNNLDTKMHLHSNIRENVMLESGLHYQASTLYDQASEGFRMKERILSGHAQLTYTGVTFHVNGGLRAAYSMASGTELLTSGREILSKSLFSLLPSLNLKYNFNQKSNLKVTYNKRLVRPGIYQLNPTAVMTDPFTVRKGNPDLDPEVFHLVSADYGRSFHENFISAGLFYRRKHNVIEYLSTAMDSVTYAREKQNLGNISHAGLKISGSMNLGNAFSLNPYVELYHARSEANELAHDLGTRDQSSVVVKTKLSAIWKIQEALSLSASIQYQSPARGIQQQYHEGALYFLSLEKVFFDKLNVGITSAIPLMRSFTYQGTTISGRDYYEESEDNILVSMVPVWIKLKYSFASGNTSKQHEQREVFREERRKEGFSLRP